MTNADKAELRGLMRRGDPRSDQEIADSIGCSSGTVAKYRRVFSDERTHGPESAIDDEISDGRPLADCDHPPSRWAHCANAASGYRCTVCGVPVPDERAAARASFGEDHSVGSSRASVKRSHRAEGRNHVD